MTTTTAAADKAAGKPVERRFEHRDDNRPPRVPFREQVKSMRMFDDNREIVVDRRCIAFAVACKDAPQEGTVIGFKLAGAKPAVVRAPFAEVKQWWLGSDAPAGNGKAA